MQKNKEIIFGDIKVKTCFFFSNTQHKIIGFFLCRGSKKWVIEAGNKQKPGNCLLQTRWHGKSF